LHRRPSYGPLCTALGASDLLIDCRVPCLGGGLFACGSGHFCCCDGGVWRWRCVQYSWEWREVLPWLIGVGVVAAGAAALYYWSDSARGQPKRPSDESGSGGSGGQPRARVVQRKVQQTFQFKNNSATVEPVITFDESRSAPIDQVCRATLSLLLCSHLRECCRLTTLSVRYTLRAVRCVLCRACRGLPVSCERTRMETKRTNFSDPFDCPPLRS
jgi:hypothetical protein